MGETLCHPVESTTERALDMHMTHVMDWPVVGIKRMTCYGKRRKRLRWRWNRNDSRLDNLHVVVEWMWQDRRRDWNMKYLL
jgi:hypothetical protein